MPGADINWEPLARWVGNDPALVNKIRGKARLQSMSDGDVLIKEGEALGNVLFVLKGTVSIVLYSSNGHEVRLNTLEAGDWIGETAALLSTPRTAFVVAADDGVLAAVPARDFVDLMDTNGKFATQVARQLARRVTETSQRMFEFAAFSASGRIYAEVIRLSEPGSDSDERILTPAPSISDLAASLSIARETTSRTINRLERMKLLERQRDCWRVLAPERLAEMIR